MARKPNVFPSYLLHKQSGQARVRIDGKDFLLGEFGSEESRIRYGELIAKHAGGVQIDPFTKPKRGSSSTNEPEAGLTINELVLAFMRHADAHYVKNGIRRRKFTASSPSPVTWSTPTDSIPWIPLGR
jgi:hypothetical protein